MAQPEELPQNLRAALSLRELIIEGELRGGERVSETPLAARLGVSRTPLRLALAQLEHEGLLAQAPGGGFAVRSFTRKEVADAIELRGVLEGAAARMAAEHEPDARALEALHGCVSQLDGIVAPDQPAIEAFDRYVQLNERFHTLLLEMAGNHALEVAVERVLALPFASPSAFVRMQADLPESHRTLYVAQSQHRSMLEAIEAREGARAEGVAREHAHLAKRNLDTALASHHVLDRLPGAHLIALDGGADVG